MLQSIALDQKTSVHVGAQRGAKDRGLRRHLRLMVLAILVDDELISAQRAAAGGLLR